jgi:DDE family transposase
MLRDKIIEIFVNVDDFCKEIYPELEKQFIQDSKSGKRNRKAGLCDSEIITLMVAFHYGQFTNLKSFYLHYAQAHLNDLFPGLVSYNRFVELQPRSAVLFMLYVKMNCLGQCRGLSFIDSTHLKVCDNRRIHQHRVFADQAERGQCSIGWFYGFKLHLIINDQGEILSFYLTKGNVDDRDWRHFSDMTKAIFGKLFGDKGYVSKALADLLWGNGIQMIAKPKKNMKNVNLSQHDRIILRKRAIIECVNDELKNICKLQHTRHRSVSNFLLNILGALAAYAFFPKKPSLNIVFENQNNQLLLAA